MSTTPCIRLSRTTAAGLLTGFLGGLFLTGCTPPGTPKPTSGGQAAPHGQIFKDGKPLRPKSANLAPGDPGYHIYFVRLGTEEENEPIEVAVLDESEGTFEFRGTLGKNLPPGKYKVAVIMAPEGGEDAFEGKYGLERSPIEVEVKEGENLIIDLDKY